MSLKLRKDNDGNHAYTFDGENRITQLGSGSTNYRYDVAGKRAVKINGSSYTHYLYGGGGEPLSELNPTTGDFTDYIFAGGKRIARATTYIDQLQIHGTNCSNCGWQYSIWNLSGLNGYTIRTGDKLVWRQGQWSTGQGGTMFMFTDGSNTTDTAAYDQQGQLMYSDSTTGWHTRQVDLSVYAGKTINYPAVVSNGTTGAGTWDIYYMDISLVSTDGTVQPIYTGETTSPVTGVWGSSGVTNRGAWITHNATTGGLADFSTAYYHGDQIGSSRLMTNGLGHPIWQGTFLPYGEEYNPQPTVNNYKFTGKERDSESGLDFYGARYYGSSMGRFMTPDSVSYSNRKNPQSWNLYAFTLNNPVTFKDEDGHEVVCANNTGQCQKDAAASTGNAEAAKRVTTNTTTTKHSFLGLFSYTTSKTTIAISGDIKSFRALSANASKLADLVTTDKTITVNYSDSKSFGWSGNLLLHGGSSSQTPSKGGGEGEPTAWIDPTRQPGVVYDPDAIAQGIPQANTSEEFGHEVLGHIWGELFGGHEEGTRANMRDSIAGENAVRALDPTRGQKGIETHHNYDKMPPDPPK